jgi:pimeloyl-ACP methyl ester carboxylesterase
MAGAVLEVAEEFAQGAQVSLVGHSLGGRVALAASGLDSARVAHVTLLDIAPGPISVAPEVEYLLEVLLKAPDRAEDRRSMRDYLEAQGLDRPLADWLVMNLISTGTRGVRWHIDREALAEAHERWSPEDLWSLVETPESPVKLCLRGGRSPFVSETEKARLEAAGVTVATLPNAGHFLHMDDLAGVLAHLGAHQAKGT